MAGRRRKGPVRSEFVGIRQPSFSRGFLRFYVLHRLSRGPSHGYEILQDIATKTEGAWAPGAGSIYPVLKRLLSDGLVESSASKGPRTPRVYRLTAKGASHLRETKKLFARHGNKMNTFRALFVDMIEPEDAEHFILDGSRRQFQTVQEIAGTKLANLPTKEAEYVLLEYSLNLERQLEWVRDALSRLKRKVES